MSKCDDLIGAPYSKYDCWALAREAASRYGIQLPTYEDYSREKPEDIVRGFSENIGEFEEIKDPRPGDVVAFKRAGKSLHFGVVIEDGYCLHTNRELGGQRISLSNQLLKSMLKGFYRWRK